MPTGGPLPESTRQQEAQHRASAILGLQVRAQAYTLTTSDGFILIVWVVIAYLLMMLLLRHGKITFNTLARCNESSIDMTSRRGGAIGDDLILPSRE